MQQLIQLYKEQYGRNPLRVESLPKSGSNREYVRLHGTDGTSVIGVIGPDKAENACFIYLSRHFADRGLPVPVIGAVGKDASCYLQTDLGSVSLYQALSRGRADGARYNEEEKELIRRTIRMLPHLQVTGAEGLDCNRLLSPVRFDHRTAMFDLNYFRYCFLRPTGLVCDEVRLDEDFSDFAYHLLEEKNPQQIQTFLYRDFQARNVMMIPAADGGLSPCFIDYQGGQCGPLQYDVASFLWQASARYSKDLREEMIREYLDELATLMTFDREQFLRRLHSFVLFRTMQVLGAYGLRGYFERKKYFLDSIPLAIENLRELLTAGTARDWPYLDEVLRHLTELPQFERSRMNKLEKRPKGEVDLSGAVPSLVVEVLSFSYRKGLPEDPSGNGGGYVFDCRAIHNPGRYEPYRQLTGMDAPVIEFLENDGEILVFLDSVFKLAEAHVERYIRRGFTHLQFAFGCTGGQHRSVYSAQHLAEHLHRKYGLEIRLVHREQQVCQTFPAYVRI